MRYLSSLLMIGLLLLGMFGTQAHATTSYRYSDWRYNENYSRVTIQGKDYGSQILVLRIGSVITTVNVASLYLLQPETQAEIAPDLFWSAMIDGLCEVAADLAPEFPYIELISINGVPWQETGVKDAYLASLPVTYNGQIVSEFYADPTNNGYAYDVMANGLSVAMAKRQHPTSQWFVAVANPFLYRSGDEFLRDGGQPFGIKAPTFKTFRYDGFPAQLNYVSVPTQMTLHLGQRDVAWTYLRDGQLLSSGNLLTLDVAPDAPRGYTLVPARDIFETFGCEVRWLPDSQQVRIVDDTRIILLTLGSTIALVNDEPVELVEPANTVNGRTLIPLRFVSENLGYHVEWFGDDQRIVITK